MKCPECKKTMKWQEGLLVDGTRDMSFGRYYCLDCRIFAKSTESKGIRKGRKMAPELTGVHCMDKKITSQSTASQIGILRERMHCSTCNSYYPDNPCKCTDCDCLYCREK